MCILIVKKYIKKIFSVFLLLFTGLYGSSQDIVLMIGAATKQPTQFNFYYTDELAMGHPQFLSRDTEKINVKRPILLFEADRNQNCYLVNPGDTLVLTKSGNALSTTVMRKNKNYTRNTK